MTREWHRDGATIYTLKENTGRRRAGSPEFVNDNWMQVQGPDAEAVAGEVRATLGLHPVMLEALHEARLQIEYLHEKFQVTGSGETTLAKIRSAIARADGGGKDA